MKIFDNLKNIIQQAETEQKQRKEKLKQLEETISPTKANILHPLKLIENKKEYLKLKKEIENYNARKKTIILVIAAICFFVSLFSFIGIMSIVDKEHTEYPLDENYIVDYDETKPTQPTTFSTEHTISTLESTTLPTTETTVATTITTTTTTTTSTRSEQTTTENKGPVVYITPYGEKYHMSKSCAGGNAIEYNYKDAIARYEPCKKCSN